MIDATMVVTVHYNDIITCQQGKLRCRAITPIAIYPDGEPIK